MQDPLETPALRDLQAHREFKEKLDLQARKDWWETLDPKERSDLQELILQSLALLDQLDHREK